MTSRRIALLMLVLVLAGASALAQKPTTPKAGSTERKAIMDGLRAGVRDVDGLDGDIVFKVHKLSVLGPYAILTVTPVTRDLREIPAFADECMCDCEIIAFMMRQGAAWRVVERQVDPCDAPWEDFFRSHPRYPIALYHHWQSSPFKP